MTLSFLLLPQQVAANEATPTHIKNSKIFNPTQPQTSNMSSSNQTSNTSTNFIILSRLYLPILNPTFMLGKNLLTLLPGL